MESIRSDGFASNWTSNLLGLKKLASVLLPVDQLAGQGVGILLLVFRHMCRQAVAQILTCKIPPEQFAKRDKYEHLSKHFGTPAFHFDNPGWKRQAHYFQILRSLYSRPVVRTTAENKSPQMLYSQVVCLDMAEHVGPREQKVAISSSNE